MSESIRYRVMDKPYNVWPHNIWLTWIVRENKEQAIAEVITLCQRYPGRAVKIVEEKW